MLICIPFYSKLLIINNNSMAKGENEDKPTTMSVVLSTNIVKKVEAYRADIEWQTGIRVSFSQAVRALLKKATET